MTEHDRGRERKRTSKTKKEIKGDKGRKEIGQDKAKESGRKRERWRKSNDARGRDMKRWEERGRK